MANQTQIEWRELDDGTIEGARGKYDFAISVWDADVVLHVFESAISDKDAVYVESDDAKLQAQPSGWTKG